MQVSRLGVDIRAARFRQLRTAVYEAIVATSKIILDRFQDLSGFSKPSPKLPPSFWNIPILSRNYLFFLFLDIAVQFLKFQCVETRIGRHVSYRD